MTPRSNTDRREDAVAEKTRVRVTIEPGVVREVDDAELTDLARQGLIHSYDRTDHAAEVLGGTIATPGKWKAPERGDDIIGAPASMTEPAAGADGNITKGA
jgi:hypothetical protein